MHLHADSVAPAAPMDAERSCNLFDEALLETDPLKKVPVFKTPHTIATTVIVNMLDILGGWYFRWSACRWSKFYLARF